MKKEELFRAIGEAEDQMAADSQRSPSGKSRGWVRWGVLAACIFLAGGLFVTVPGLYRTKPSLDEGSSLDGSEYSHESGQESSAAAQQEQSDVGVWVPAIKLPEKVEAGTSMDMIGLIVYQGRIYTQNQTLFYTTEGTGEQIEFTDAYLGHAKGNIDEWSEQDAYAQEFASTCVGDVYSVKGYDANFRLCLVNEYENENGEPEKYISFFENLNGISLKTGSDLFEDRLKISESLVSVSYVLHDDWSNAENPEFHQLTCSGEQFEQFYNELINGEFEYVHDTKPALYDSSRQGHLYLNLEDGTTVSLRLIDGGYVGYQNLGWYFVRIPEEIFDTILNACQ